MEYVAFAADVARAAGEILNYYAARDKRVEHKGRANLVTVADRESEALIIREIHARYPTHTILAEESGLVDSSNEAPDPDRWIIDPLDGTTNYGPPVSDVLRFGGLRAERENALRGRLRSGPR